MRISLLPITICLAGIALAQTSADTPQDAKVDTSAKDAKVHTSAKHDVGSGAADVGKGAAKGVGSAAAGTGRAAGDLVTLHPVHAAGDLGAGAVKTGKNVGSGTVKGTGKMLKGAGKAIKHLL
jgi:hypothetical protein